ncbi:MAG: hypothetical protein ABI790_15970 [Betaproteobacteria bacterium]
MTINRLRTARNLARALPHLQGGVVLFISLVVLVAMSLAGLALLRSVDTTVMVSGNIALKQSTVLGADNGTQAAITWLEANVSGATLQSTNASAGYFSSLPLPDPADWFDDGVWTNARPVNSGAADASGNRLSYLIHRQCTLPDTAYDGVSAGVTNQCAAIDESVGGSVLTEGDSFRAGVGNVFARSKKVYYRITTRVLGPRNAVSIIQTTVALQA